MSMIELKRDIMAMWIVHKNDYGEDNSDSHGHGDVTIKGMVNVIITFKVRLTVSVMLL